MVISLRPKQSLKMEHHEAKALSLSVFWRPSFGFRNRSLTNLAGGTASHVSDFGCILHLYRQLLLRSLRNVAMLFIRKQSQSSIHYFARASRFHANQ